MPEIGFLPNTRTFPADTDIRHFISNILPLPPDLLGYSTSRHLVRTFQGKAVIEGVNGGSFALPEFAAAGHCTMTYRPEVFAHIAHDWEGQKKHGFTELLLNALVDVIWKENQLTVLLLTSSTDFGNARRYWVIADEVEAGKTFVDEVLTFGCSVRGEILVFDCGRWHKDRELVKSIEQASFENLVLKAGQADSILREMEWFFESREVYERFDAPWKRGALLIGPPGNGKTHTLKALINRLRKPTVYVKSLEQGGDAPSQDGLRYVFNRVRSLAPCILVLEDLDSMITDDNRSYFLNEMDGFASNSGVLVLATTNHPERIDPAIAHRPSRFDRKYHFDLPETAERKSYLQMWNSQRSPEGQIRFEDSDIDSVARETEGFSYAYIKELMLSVVMECFHRNGNRPIRDIALEQAAQLRKQMSSAESDKAGEVNDNGNNPGAVANDNRPTRKERKRVRRERGGDRSF